MLFDRVSHKRSGNECGKDKEMRSERSDPVASVLFATPSLCALRTHSSPVRLNLGRDPSGHVTIC